MLWTRIRNRVRIILVTWIRTPIIKQKSESASGSTSNKNQDPDPRQNTHKFADYKPKSIEYEPIWALFKGSGSLEPDPDSHQGEKSDSDTDPHPHQIKIRIRIHIRIRIRVISWIRIRIRIRIKMMRLHNTDLHIGKLKNFVDPHPLKTCCNNCGTTTYRVFTWALSWRSIS